MVLPRVKHIELHFSNILKISKWRKEKFFYPPNHLKYFQMMVAGQSFFEILSGHPFSLSLEEFRDNQQDLHGWLLHSSLITSPHMLVFLFYLSS